MYFNIIQKLASGVEIFSDKEIRCAKPFLAQLLDYRPELTTRAQKLFEDDPEFLKSLPSIMIEKGLGRALKAWVETITEEQRPQAMAAWCEQARRADYIRSYSKTYPVVSQYCEWNYFARHAFQEALEKGNAEFVVQYLEDLKYKHQAHDAVNRPYMKALDDLLDLDTFFRAIQNKRREAVFAVMSVITGTTPIEGDEYSRSVDLLHVVWLTFIEHGDALAIGSRPEVVKLSFEVLEKYRIALEARDKQPSMRAPYFDFVCKAFKGACMYKDPCLLNYVTDLAKKWGYADYLEDEFPVWLKRKMFGMGRERSENWSNTVWNEFWSTQEIQVQKDGIASSYKMSSSAKEMLFLLEKARDVAGPKFALSLIQDRNYRVIRYLFYKGELDQVRALLAKLEELGGSSIEVLDETNVFDDVVCSGNLELVKYLYELAVQKAGVDFACQMVTRSQFEYLKETSGKNLTAATVMFVINHLNQEAQKTALALLPEQWRFVLTNDKLSAPQKEQILGKGEYRWLNVFRKLPPEGLGEKLSPYSFKPKLYKQLLPILQTARGIEGTSGGGIGDNVQGDAHKLAVMFASIEEVAAYVNKCFGQFMQQGEHRVVTKACDFSVPKNGLWTPASWKRILLKDGITARRYMTHAPMIEYQLNKLGKPFPARSKELKAFMVQVCLVSQDPEMRLLGLALHYSIPEDRYTEAMDVLQRADDATLIPARYVDGADCGHPDYYMTVLPAGDPTGLVLGDITECCQSIGKVGSKYAQWGMTGRSSGFYVWRKKDTGEIVAQSLVRIDEKRNVVFDSFERQDEASNALVLPFLEQFAWDIADSGKGLLAFKGVRLGTGGKTPCLDLPIANANKFNVGEKTDDSLRQYIILPVNHRGAVDRHLYVSPKLASIRNESENFVAKALSFIKEQYGIMLRIGVEVECYALDEHGHPITELDCKQVQVQLEQFGVEKFWHENYHDRKGQYEFSVGMKFGEDPLDVLKKAEAIRQELINHPEKFGVHSFNFKAYPFEKKEPSSVQISLSFLDEKGTILSADPRGNVTVLTYCIAQGILMMQQNAALLFTQNSDAFARFGTSAWAPSIIASAKTGENQSTLKIVSSKNSMDHDKSSMVRIEERMAGADADMMIVFAALLAGVRYSLSRDVTVVKDEADANANAVTLNSERMHAGDRCLQVERLSHTLAQLELPRTLDKAVQRWQCMPQEIRDIFGPDFVKLVDEQLSQSVTYKAAEEQGNFAAAYANLHAMKKDFTADKEVGLRVSSWRQAITRSRLIEALNIPVR